MYICLSKGRYCRLMGFFFFLTLRQAIKTLEWFISENTHHSNYDKISSTFSIYVYIALITWAEFYLFLTASLCQADCDQRSLITVEDSSVKHFIALCKAQGDFPLVGRGSRKSLNLKSSFSDYFNLKLSGLFICCSHS